MVRSEDDITYNIIMEQGKSLYFVIAAVVYIASYTALSLASSPGY